MSWQQKDKYTKQKNMHSKQLRTDLIKRYVDGFIVLDVALLR